MLRQCTHSLRRAITLNSSSSFISWQTIQQGPARLARAMSSNPGGSSTTTMKAPEIQLDRDEEKVLNLIDNFTKHLASTRPDLPSVECRVNGGWVRDKLLGLPCDDLDVCISSLTGHHFATLLEEYLAQLRSTDPLITTSKIAKIQANPDQSKHLETAKMHVLGMEMDFVQLRSEEYADGQGSSRIPTNIKFGTPLEDALRRDITINTLFYNIHTRSVEDWTEKGLPDLLSSHKLIRTPLEPRQTFLDDPLRILRCIRFASRFGFPLDDSIKPAVLEEDVRSALLTKVSKERIGVELDKMLKGPDPLLALRLMHDLSLYGLIFAPIDPPLSISARYPQDAAEQAILAGEIFSNLSQDPHRSSQLPTLLSHVDDKTTRKRLWLALGLSPLSSITYQEKKKTVPLTDTIIRDSIKLPTSDRIFVQRINSAHAKLSTPKLQRFTGKGKERERSTIGILLRDIDVQDLNNGLEWQTSVLYSMVLDLLPAWRRDEAATRSVMEIYTRFVDRIMELRLDKAAFEKPRLDGNEISAVLQAKPGRLMTVLTQRVIEWQLDNPEGSKEDCAAFLKAEWEAGHVHATAEQQAKYGPEDKPARKKRKESM